MCGLDVQFLCGAGHRPAKLTTDGDASPSTTQNRVPGTGDVGIQKSKIFSLSLYSSFSIFKMFGGQSLDRLAAYPCWNPRPARSNGSGSVMPSQRFRR